MSNAKLELTNQKLAPGDLITLFALDLEAVGVTGVQLFTNSIEPSEETPGLTFGGNFYHAVDFQSEGWEFNGQGAFPRPRLTITNVGGFLSGLLYDYQDLVGCKITRLRTYAEFLDGMPNADPDVFFPPDIYRIHQKVKHNRKIIQFDLAAAVDQEGQKVPTRKILRDTCTHTYRNFVPGDGFNYEHVTCPYTGTNYFNENGEVVTGADADRCGLQLRDCKLRFGLQNLPTRAFPGVVRVKL